jgi:hypothetical protein
MTWRAGLYLLCVLSAGVAAPAVAQTRLEQDVLVELNRARADPAGYAAGLRDYRRYYDGKIVSAPGMKIRYITEEGVAPLDEAVAFLQRQDRRRGLKPAAVLRDAASDHCAEQAGDGSVGHDGTDGSSPGIRAQRRGGGIFVGEVITYGSTSAVDVVRQLIVDDGVGDRGHRKLVFADDLDFAGVSCGPHPVYGTMCVVDVARTVDGRSRMQFAAN